MRTAEYLLNDKAIMEIMSNGDINYEPQMPSMDTIVGHGLAISGIILPKNLLDMDESELEEIKITPIPQILTLE